MFSISVCHDSLYNNYKSSCLHINYTHDSHMCQHINADILQLLWSLFNCKWKLESIFYFLFLVLNVDHHVLVEIQSWTSMYPTLNVLKMQGNPAFSAPWDDQASLLQIDDNPLVIHIPMVLNGIWAAAVINGMSICTNDKPHGHKLMAKGKQMNERSGMSVKSIYSSRKRHHSLRKYWKTVIFRDGCH